MMGAGGSAGGMDCPSAFNRRSSPTVLLWMYCREIAPFETPTFVEKVGELIARATSTPSARL